MGRLWLARGVFGDGLSGDVRTLPIFLTVETVTASLWTSDSLLSIVQLRLRDSSDRIRCAIVISMSESSVASEPPSPALRKTIIRRALMAVGLLATVAFGLVFPFPFEGRLSGQIFDLAHAPVFCVALLCLVGFCDPPAVGLPRRFTTILPMKIGRVVAITVAVLIAGIVGEYSQKFAGRNASWGDVAANSAGLLAALGWIASQAVAGVRRKILVLAALSLLVAVSVNPLRNIWDSIQQIRSFPMLSSFERSRSTGSWAGYRADLERSTEWSSHGDYSLKATLSPDENSGVAMVWFKRDWRDLTSLHLDLMNPNDEPLTLIVKVLDEYHTRNGFQHSDRFTRRYVVTPGDTANVKINMADIEAAPVSRKMNLKWVWAIEIFSPDVKVSKVFFVDNVRLKK